VTLIRIGGKEFAPEVVQAMVDAGLLSGAKNDTSSTTPSASPLHGPFPGNNNQFGPFSGSGSRPGMWNATLRPRGISALIPMYKSVYYNELIDVATGVTAGSGNNVTSACAVGPKPGQLKKMKLSASFGIIHMSTKIIDVTQAGMRRNRADIDRTFYNAATVDNPWIPQLPGVGGIDPNAGVMRTEMYALGINLERNVGQVHYVGVSGTENNTYRGVARQWNGLDRLIRTGYLDADTQVAAPAADSTVVSFNAAADGGTDAFGRNVVGALMDTYYGVKDFLSQMGIVADFALSMRPDLFRALAAIWACNYSIVRCTSSAAGAPVLRDSTAQRALYDSLMQTNTLPMDDGTNLQVVLDDNIARDTLGNNYFKSDIYGVALRGNGIPVLYGEYFDMGNPEAMEVVNFTGMDNDTMVVNDGMYRVFKYKTGGCYEYDFFARPRLITDAPFMHFRLDDVFYRADYSQRDATPGMSYHQNGGLTYQS
jgi:hypothetical protein